MAFASKVPGLLLTRGLKQPPYFCSELVEGWPGSPGLDEVGDVSISCSRHLSIFRCAREE